MLPIFKETVFLCVCFLRFLPCARRRPVSCRSTFDVSAGSSCGWLEAPFPGNHTARYLLV